MSEMMRSPDKIAQFIDHTLLKPDAIGADFERHFIEAMEYKFYSVCIPPHYVSIAKRFLKSSNVKVCTVIGFPFGYNTTATKAYAAKMAVDQGADELDMVINISALKSGDLAMVTDDLRSVVHASLGKPVKVILECTLLTQEEKIRACELAMKAGAQFVKTSTGFADGGATESDVKTMVQCVQGRLGVKASGGIRDYDTALQFLNLGATRLGTSSSVAIVSGEKRNQVNKMTGY